MGNVHIMEKTALKKTKTPPREKSPIVEKICGYYSLCSAKNKIQTQVVVFNFICYLKVHDLFSAETRVKGKGLIFSAAYRLLHDLFSPGHLL